jgi:tetratricopeptide (TPR) repeat protein
LRWQWSKPELAEEHAQDLPKQMKTKRQLMSLFRSIGEKASLLRSLVLNCLLLLMLAVSLPILFVELKTDRVVIQPLSVPWQIETTGLTGTVVANRLWDAWSRLNSEVAIAKETRDVLPSSQRIEFEIPDSGLSFDSLIHHLRSFIGYHDTTLSGEMICDSDPCNRTKLSMRLRLIDDDLHVIQLPIMGLESEDQYWQRAMTEVLLVVDPVRGILAARVNNAGKEGADERAIAELRKLVRANHPEANWALAYAGSLLQDGGDTPAARASFDEALKRDPIFAFALRLRSAAELKDGNGAAARASILQSLALAPDNASNLIQLGHVEARSGNVAAAHAAYAKAAKLQPNWPQIPLSVGMMHWQANDKTAAMAAYREALVLEPDFVEAHQLLALGLSLDRDHAGSIKHQQAVVRLKPNDAAEHAQLAGFHEANADFAAAVTAYQTAVDLSPDNARIKQQFGSLMLKQNKPDAALEQFLKAQILDTKLPDLWFQIAESHRTAGHTAEAIKAYEAYTKSEPQGLWIPFAQAHMKKLQSTAQ